MKITVNFWSHLVRTYESYNSNQSIFDASVILDRKSTTANLLWKDFKYNLLLYVPTPAYFLKQQYRLIFKQLKEKIKQTKLKTNTPQKWKHFQRILKPTVECYSSLLFIFFFLSFLRKIVANIFGDFEYLRNVVVVLFQHKYSNRKKEQQIINLRLNWFCL